MEVQHIGKTFNYSRYFHKRSAKIQRKRIEKVTEFITQLEAAIILAVKLTSGVTKAFNLNAKRRMSRSKQCAICQSVIPNENERFVVHFHAKKVSSDSNYANNGHILEWSRPPNSDSQEISANEWTSGPMVMCTLCRCILLWYEEEQMWTGLRSALEKREYSMLPPIVSFYSELISAMRLAEFFITEYVILSKNPTENTMRLEQLRQSLSSSRTTITEIGGKIENLNNDGVGTIRCRRELLLQSNIRFYASFFCVEICVPNQKTTLPEDQKMPTALGVWTQLQRAFCPSVFLRAKLSPTR